MTVADNVGAGTEAVAISPSPPSSITSQGSGVSTNDDQDGEIGSHVERSDGGESLKQRDMRELQELLSKLNPMAEEFVPPSMTKQGGVNGFNGVNGGFFTVAGSFLPSNGFGAAGYFPVNEDGGFRRVLRHNSCLLSLLCFCVFKLQFSHLVALVVCFNVVSSVFLCVYKPKLSPLLSCLCRFGL